MRNEVRTMKKRLTVMISMLCILMNFSGCEETLERDETESYNQEFQNPDGDTKKKPTPTVRPTPTEEPEESVKMVPKVTQPLSEEMTEGGGEKEEPVTQPVREEKTVEGYIIRREETILYLDLENTGSRIYPGEGKDRAVAFDISHAEISLMDQRPFPANSDPLVQGSTVLVTYYVENGQNIATVVLGDGDEKEPIVPPDTTTPVPTPTPEPLFRYAAGYIQDRQGDIIYLMVDYMGTTGELEVGEDGTVPFDISGAGKRLRDYPEWIAPDTDPAQIGCYVDVSYDVENGVNKVITLTRNGIVRGEEREK